METFPINIFFFSNREIEEERVVFCFFVFFLDMDLMSSFLRVHRFLCVGKGAHLCSGVEYDFKLMVIMHSNH